MHNIPSAVQCAAHAIMNNLRFQTGMDILLGNQRKLLSGRRIGLLTHPAALLNDGQWSPNAIFEDQDIRLQCVFGPEHGIFGHAGAGEPVPTQIHPRWNIPIYSLYGEHRQPTPEMLEPLDMLVIDLQDLGVRCYTFCSTLALCMQAAEEHSLPVVVADRPIPFPGTVDGPMLDLEYRSFVAHLDVPLVYGMTQGETARWLASTSFPRLELTVINCAGYDGCPHRPVASPPWVPPSIGIRSWESAWCYPVTVFTEALPALSCGRDGALAFQLLGAPWLEGERVAQRVNDLALPGIECHPHPMTLDWGDEENWSEGIRIHVSDPQLFLPVTTGISLLGVLRDFYGNERIWSHGDTRPQFFDSLCGTDSVRRALLEDVSVRDITRAWLKDNELFSKETRFARKYV